jgi:hypothetical protein
LNFCKGLIIYEQEITDKLEIITNTAKNNGSIISQDRVDHERYNIIKDSYMTVDEVIGQVGAHESVHVTNETAREQAYSALERSFGSPQEKEPKAIELQVTKETPLSRPIEELPIINNFIVL